MANDTEYRQIVYRLLPGSREKARRLAALAGTCRFVWSGLRAMLGYKAPRLVAVNAAQTSRTCAECGTEDAASRPSQATFTCVACGHADLNAARNIRRRGQAHLHGEGALPSGTPMIRETDRRLAA